VCPIGWRRQRGVASTPTRSAQTAARADLKKQMASTLVKKLGAKAAMRAILLHAPAEVIRSMRSAKLDMKPRLAGAFDFIHAFLIQERKLQSDFPRLKRHLEPTGVLWISWPKKHGLDTDLSMTRIIKIGYGHGLVESKCVSVNSDWSGIKFTFPRKGKTYHNSYGKLKR
jgi:hypothetical protein